MVQFLNPLFRILFRVIAAQGIRIDHRPLHIQGHIQPDRAAPPALHQVQSFLRTVPHILFSFNHDRVLGHRGGTLHNIVFLYPGGAELQSHSPHGRHIPGLSGYDEDRYGFHPGAQAAGQCVGRSRPGRNQHTGRTVINAGIRFSSHRAGLFIVLKGTVDAAAVAKRVVEVHGPSSDYHKSLPDTGFKHLLHDIIRYFYFISHNLFSVFHKEPQQNCLAAHAHVIPLRFHVGKCSALRIRNTAVSYRLLFCTPDSEYCDSMPVTVLHSVPGRPRIHCWYAPHLCSHTIVFPDCWIGIVPI